MNDSKQCPYCAETIKAQARLCRFCNRDLDDAPPPPPVHQPPPKPANSSSDNLGTIVAGIVTLAAIAWYIIAGGFSAPNSATENGNPSPASVFSSASRQLTYKVTGTASSASVTYHNPQGGTVQSDVTLPWETTLTFKDGDFSYISAQNRGESGGVTTEILIDGVAWKKTSSNGAYMIADCSGTVAKP